MLRLTQATLILGVIAGGMACGGSSKAVKGPKFLLVEDAQLPHRVLSEDGRSVSANEFSQALHQARAVCVGESHTDSHHHWAQLEVLKLVSAKEGIKLGVGMEMFQRPFQGVLDDFSAGKIGEDQLLEHSDWERRWRYDWRYYAPMVRHAVEREGALLALNVSKELKEKWKELGTEGLSEADRQKFPELDLNDETHKRWFRNLMESMNEDHGTDDSSHAFEGDPEQGALPQPAHPPAEEEVASEADFIDTIYPVQVLWDETMADTAARWVQAEEGRVVVILAGNGHCHHSAIVNRMKRRGVDATVSVRPVIETGAGEVADLLADPQNDYLFVMKKPL